MLLFNGICYYSIKFFGDGVMLFNGNKKLSVWML